MNKKKHKKEDDPISRERRERVAYNLQRLRSSRGIKTANELLDRMSEEMIDVINPSYMRRLESAHAPFGSDMEQRFIKFYKVDVSEFYRPPALSEKDIEIEYIRDVLMQLDIEKVRRIRELIPVVFGGESERRSENPEIPKEKKTA